MLRLAVLQLSLAAYPFLHAKEARDCDSSDESRLCEHTSLLQMNLQLTSQAKERFVVEDVSRESAAETQTPTTDTDGENTTMSDAFYANAGTNSTEILPDNGVDPAELYSEQGVEATRDAEELQSINTSTSMQLADVISAPFPSPAPPAESVLGPAVNESMNTTKPPLELSSSTTTTTTIAAPYSEGNATNSTISSMINPMPNLTAEEAASLNASRAQAQLDCTVAEWSDWSGCGQLGKAGENGLLDVKTRQRDVITPQSLGGAACPDLEEVQGCTAEADDA